MIQYGIISAFVIIYLSVNIQNLHSGACFRFSVLQGNRVLEWSWIRKLFFSDPNPTLMKSSAKQGTESEAISSTTTCFFPFMDPAWINPGNPEGFIPSILINGQALHLSSQGVVWISGLEGSVATELLERCKIFQFWDCVESCFPYSLNFFSGMYLQPAIFFYPESPCFIFFMRWPGTYRPLREDSLGTCNCSTVAGEVTCAVIATRWG